jgi:predicted transcriptional regulator YdeE
MEPKFVDRKAFTVMGILVHAMPDKVNYKAVWEDQFMPHHDHIKAYSTDQAYYGVWFPHHEDGVPDYIAGMAVSEGAPAPEGVTAREVPASRYAVFECTMETIGQTYGYIYNTWLAASPYEFPPGCTDFEYYPPEGSEGTPAVYIPIREKVTQ